MEYFVSQFKVTVCYNLINKEIEGEGGKSSCNKAHLESFLLGEKNRKGGKERGRLTSADRGSRRVEKATKRDREAERQTDRDTK